MHDCRQTQASLIDLLFDEADDAGARARLIAEAERCGACAAEYRSLATTLEACDEVSSALAPGEDYWPQYHEALTRRLLAAADDARGARVPPPRTPFWKRVLTASIRVPVPVASVAVLLLIAACGIALLLIARPAPEPLLLAAPHIVQPPQAAPQIKFIEVPVIQEKIVTQTIYLPRRAEDGAPARRLAPRENLSRVGRQNAPVAPAANTNGDPSRAKLSGFKPAGEVNLRIIKGSDAREQ